MRAVRVLAILLLLGAAGAGYVIYSLNQPYAGFANQVFIDFPKGTPTERIAEKLRDAGVIRSKWQFLAARLLHRGRTLQAGEYRFDKPASVLDVYERLARGDVFFYVLVVPEGRNMFDIGAEAERLGTFPAHSFVEAAGDPSLIRDLDPLAPSLEGYLFPDTYRLTRNTTPEGLCRMMTAKFREVWRSLKTDAGIHKTVTLASMVEREGKLGPERPLIASVFQNRLRIGMKLDCDPTTIYAALLDGHYRGSIYKSDLEDASPYNTYRNNGLPPGPIANPGLASIEAVLHPAETDYLYFVVRPDGSGGHAFSENLTAHAVAVHRYRRADHEETAPAPVPRQRKNRRHRGR